MKKVMWEVLMKKQEETELLMSKEKHKWKKKSDLERYVARNKKWR
jgi:hypothetical protein